jgi:RNA polymerase-binding transcription factor DksA
MPSKKTPADKTAAKPKSSKAKPKTEATAETPATAAPKAAKKNGAPAKKEPVKLSPFHEKQRERLLILKDTLLDSMNGVARDSLRNAGDSESAFGMHQADAGSDAYDRDFALGLLSQEQDSLYEIDEALKRLEDGAYGNCEMSGKPIMKARLEALPFTRYTVECQAEIEKRSRYQKHNQPVTSLFGLTDGDEDGDEDDSSSDSKD